MKTELLAPVGSWDAFYAAIYNRADAVYLGGKAFGARAYADNFTNEEIKDIIVMAHLHGVKVYVTINTLVYDHEFAQLIDFLDFLYLHDCDAVIVQDLGVAQLILHRYPKMALHASTQMNIHSLAQVQALKARGFKRVILAREVSLTEIIAIKKAVDIELEVFVHGALCISCSGHCYLSSIIGKRSGNRGRCAQPCRLKYEFQGGNKYFISPKDLNTLAYLPQLLDAQIDSFKIEGRMKRPEYCRRRLQSYRQAMDAYQDGSEIDLVQTQENLKKIFNRQFTKGWLLDEKNDNLINEDFSNHIGIEIGQVIKSHKHYVDIKLSHPLNYGDALRIKGQNEDALVVNQMYCEGKIIKQAQAGQIVSLKAHMDGLNQGIVYLTTDQQQIIDLQASFRNQNRQFPIEGVLFLQEQHLMLRLEYKNHSVQVASTEAYQLAKSLSSNERLLSQIQKTGSSPFYFDNLQCTFSENIYLPIKVINELRRSGLEELTQVVANKHGHRFPNERALPSLPSISLSQGLVAKVRTEQQLHVVAGYPFQEIYVTDEGLMKWQSFYPQHRFLYVIPRINHHQFTDGVFVSSDIGNLNNNHSSIYLPVTNAYSLYHLFSQGVKRVGLSLELSWSQIKQLLTTFQSLFSQKPNLEMMVYGRYELMMMKYCLLKKHGGCEHCDAETTQYLIDRRGFSFPIFKDEQCCVKILNSKRLHLGDYLKSLIENGVTNLLLDFTIENADETKMVCEIYCNNKQEMSLNDVTFGHFKEGVL